jgi:hypothetical protein
VLHAPLRNSQLTKISFRNIGIFFPGHIQRYPASNPSIIKHHTNTWPDVTPVRQKKCPLHPSKAATINAKIDKLCIVGFIYPITYTSWVSNPVLVNKKEGIVRVCTNFHDLNHDFPKYFIDQIIDDYASHDTMSFMDCFSRYNQIQIHPVDQYKTIFTTPWGTFLYRVIPFGLKNVGATFQWAMNYILHDLAHIILAYLDDFTTRSKKKNQHLDDLWVVFQGCRHYNMRLNPLKCVFYVTIECLLGLVVF